MSDRDTFDRAIAYNTIKQWEDWLEENGHIRSMIAQDCKDYLADLITARIEMIRENKE